MLLAATAAALAFGCAADDFIDGALVPSTRTLDFGAVPVGQKAFRDFELRLTRGPPTQLLGVETEGEWASRYRFIFSDTRIRRDTPETVTVAFVPDSVGLQDGVLRIPGDGVGLSAPVQIRGEGILQGIAATPSVLNFDPVVVGSDDVRRIQVENLGSQSVTVRSLSTANIVPCSPQATAPFCFVDPSRAIPPGGRARVEIRYRPQGKARVDEAELQIWGCENFACRTRVLLRAEAVEEGLDCRPRVLDFGKVAVGRCADRTMTCAVKGDLNVQFQGVKASSPAFGTTDQRAVVLSRGSKLDLPVQFCPRDLAAYTGTLEVRTKTAGRAERIDEFRMVGRGGASRLVVEPAVVDFGDLAAGLSGERTLTIKNVGAEPVDVNDVEVDVARTGALTSPDAGPVTLLPGQEVRWTLVLRPTQVGLLATTVRFSSSDAVNPTKVVSVLARAIDLPPCDFEVTQPVEFDSVLRGQAAVRTIIFDNQGSADCIVGSVRLQDASGSFYLIDDGLGGRLPPGRWPLRVAFAPRRVGHQHAQLSWSVSNPQRPRVELQLYGTGADDALLIGPQNVDFGARPVGCATGDRSVRLWNVSGTEAMVQSIDWQPAPPSGVELDAGPLPAVLAPGAPITIELSDAALTRGTDAVSLRLSVQRGSAAPFLQTIDVSRRVEAGLAEEDRFVQQPRRAVDVLMVVDHTQPMREEIALLRQVAPLWIDDAHRAGLSYHFGVLTTDLDEEDGVLLPADVMSSARIVDRSSTPSPAHALVDLLSVRTLSFSDGSEKGLASLERALSADRLFGDNSGFVRRDAHLSVVIVAQHADRSSSELQRYVDRLRGLKGAWNPQDVSVHAIVGDPALGCSGATGSAEAAPRYSALSHEFLGENALICSSDWRSMVSDLSLAVLGERRRFALTKKPNVGGVNVWVNQQLVSSVDADGVVNWSYDPAQNAIVFPPSRVPEAGDEIRVRYNASCG